MFKLRQLFQRNKDVYTPPDATERMLTVGWIAAGTLRPTREELRGVWRAMAKAAEKAQEE